jgi:hypothetical protein
MDPSQFSDERGETERADLMIEVNSSFRNVMFPSGSLVVEALCYKSEGRGFDI